ncbi:hypothetical protein AB4455_04240 [Vibrio sp. 10N.261.46.E12]|uniref:hypothetical protein n=1 Tax=unclassified Vibrio TaxID=2614977 RepID=UPI00097634E1|nr:MULTISPECIES: hypothetical protein [unclassified Vibrio]OMO36544.1 hypothetical protein BH584_25740 [Vibrio sp. 10N.261.45.E1]PMJ28531.1 hypothetical protein BCU27_04765 [Vibrio sp. 10N.286.45.B6]PML98570.1 hypothetical protein BCT66_01615 [Vibrio sp. 10N.261.49.E11]PMM68203.1 hypothetical protein BCT48_12145 [Vibrio sp. 10N.261.46.F12]PMM83009.1 hypothetical protein BCT46_13195 [Vibrio sp. 10N.261.46.E8]
MHSALKVAALGLALVAGFYGPQTIKHFKSAMEHTSTDVNLDDYCMLSTISCMQNAVEMTLDSETAQPLVPSKIKVVWEGAASNTLMLSLTGLEMEMGSARFQLKNIGDNTYEGDVILPVCTMDEMTWLGELTDGIETVNPAIRMAR